LRHPRERLEQQSQRLDNLELRLKNHVKTLLGDYKNRLQQLQIRQQAQHPQVRLQQLTERVASCHTRLQTAQFRLIERKQKALGEAARMLNTLSPLNTLDRGYALVTDEQTQKVITRSDQVIPGTTVNTRVAQGEFVCRVESIRK
jgi:exodeoxyribonuclease VII large subunit